MLTDTKEEESVQEEISYQTIAEFLEGNPPNQLIHISDIAVWKIPSGYPSGRNIMKTPEIQLHCSHESCKKIKGDGGI